MMSPRGVLTTSIFLAMLCVPAVGADLPSALAHCTAISDPAARLACFDALAVPYKGVVAPTPTPVSAAPISPVAPTLPAAQTKAEQFGSERLPSPPAAEATPEIDSLTAEVEKVEFGPTGRFVVTLNNGQVWQQSPGDTDKAHFPRQGPVTVTIARGLMGSYNLTIGEGGRLYKVRRIR